MSETPKYNPDDGEENKERESLADFTWGEGVPTVENHSGLIACITDGCKSNNEPISNLFRVGIGIKDAPLSIQRPGKRYAMICQCPDCSRNFWFHIGDVEAKLYKECYNNGMFVKANPKK